MGILRTGHGTDWLFDARGDRIEVGDEVLFVTSGTELHTGYIKTIRQNGGVEIAGWLQNYERWARDVVLNCARENIHLFVGHRG